MVRNGSARRLHTLIVRTGSGQSIMLCCILPPPTYSTTPTQHGPSRSSSSNGGIIISRAAIADACQLPHRQQQQGGNPATEKRNKKDVKYKFPWIRPEPFPMLRLFIWLEKEGIDWLAQVYFIFSDVDIERRTPYPSVEKQKQKKE